MRDSNNFTSQVLDALSECNFYGDVNIAIGSQAPYLQALSNSIKKYNSKSKITFSMEVTSDPQVFEPNPNIANGSVFFGDGHTRWEFIPKTTS